MPKYLRNYKSAIERSEHVEKLVMLEETDVQIQHLTQTTTKLLNNLDSILLSSLLNLVYSRLLDVLDPGRRIGRKSTPLLGG